MIVMDVEDPIFPGEGCPGTMLAERAEGAKGGPLRVRALHVRPEQQQEAAPMSDVLASPRFLVMGCGAIGGVVTAALAETGQDVTAVTTNPTIHAAVTERGLKVVGEGAPRIVRANVSLGVPTGGEKFDYVLLATQPPQVEDAARSALPALADDGVMVCLQNGLCEQRIAKIAGEDRVLGAVVGWGATMPEPGLYEKTASGGFTIGYPGGDPLGPETDDLISALEAVGPVETTQNLRGKRWSKLAINCAISSLGTIGGDRLGALLQHRFVRRLALEIMTEVHGRAQGRRPAGEGLRHARSPVDRSHGGRDALGRLAEPRREARPLACGRVPLPSDEELDALRDRARPYACG
jgi:2-dehydropantoate 2-reductase